MTLQTQVGRAYDESTVARDVRQLWSLGRFSDVTVEKVEHEDGADVIFHVTREPQYPLREIRLLPHTFGVTLSLPAGTLVTNARAHDLAQAARRQLNDRGYARAKVESQLVAAPGGKADVVLRIEPGEAVRFKPTATAHVRAPRWYTPGVVEAHAARLRSLWMAAGYFDARVITKEEISAKAAKVAFHVDRSPLYHPIDTKPLCACLFEERREAEAEGVLDFQVNLDTSGAYSIERGPAYTVHRIRFAGHTHYSDAAIRRHFLLDEGAPLDSWKLRQSIARLNRSGWFEPLDEHHFRIETDARTHTADIVVQLTERKRGAWNFSGPLPITAAIGARLPAWGQGILELSTYTASLNLVAYSTILKLATNRRFLPVLALDRPFTPGGGWLSGFSIAPQLGPRYFVAGYVATQLEQRIQPLLLGTRVPDLAAAMGDGAILCEAPQPRLRYPRMGASFALRFASTLIQ